MTGGAGPRRGPGRGKGGERAYFRFLHLGTQLALLVVLGVLGGQWLDRRFGLDPMLTLAGALSGIGLGLAVVIREASGTRR